ncbi:MAG TPA: type II secretion system F family protein, partial [Candidatus Baltobacteraceae bacterium]|nr:type II secretion system F family protein [Candidatus Baltobacteraceae bacterium]
RVPVLGAIAAKSLGLRFARTLGTLVRSGVDVVGAIEVAAGVVDGYRFRQGLRNIVDALRSGETLAAPLGASGLFDATFVQLVRAGEESGALDEMLLKIASYHELDVETSLSTLSSVLEPLLICLLGAIVGTIVASVIIPLYSMIGSIK